MKRHTGQYALAPILPPGELIELLNGRAPERRALLISREQRALIANGRTPAARAKLKKRMLKSGEIRLSEPLRVTDDPNPESQKRMSRIVAGLQFVQRKVNGRADSSGRIFSDCTPGENDELEWLFKRIRKYRYTYSFNSLTGGLEHLRATRTDNPPRHEFYLMETLKNLMDAGELWRLRRCAYARCDRWLYAWRHDQHYCPGSTCRQKHYQQSETFKVRRREKLKKQRAAEKKGISFAPYSEKQRKERQHGQK